MTTKTRIFLIVGVPGSGKDVLIQAVNDMGVLHARIVPKHTSRERQSDDGNEMICSDDNDYDLAGCDITYENYENKYGIKSFDIWNNINDEVAQVIVVSNIRAINKLLAMFGSVIKIVFIHSSLNVEEYHKEQIVLGNSTEYIENRISQYDKAINMFLKNYNYFDHVLIFESSQEDLFDQIFRLLNYYEGVEL
ncbi:MAG: hypothetical protein JKY81_09385 [Colwellia sp.]|nr:hypothetical protein [Colwellia sp.]